MKRASVLQHRFVEFIPDTLEDGVLYVSIAYATAAHRCCCGCGKEVVTPITPTDWQLTFDGESISLYPSIGNWSFPCQSHYWIKQNSLKWAARMTQEEIAAGRAYDRIAKRRHFNGQSQIGTTPKSGSVKSEARTQPWAWLKKLLS